jgi:predicted hydrolase (HD superfamily)
LLTRFELFVILRNQVSDRRLVRRAVAVEAAMEELARLAGADPAVWGLAGLGADIDAQLTQKNALARGGVAAELLATEGAPQEITAAVAERFAVSPGEMSSLAASLVVASALVDIALADLADGETLDALDGRALAHRLRRLDQRGDEEAARVLACAVRAKLELDAAAASVVTGMLRVREDLKL